MLNHPRLLTRVSWELRRNIFHFYHVSRVYVCTAVRDHGCAWGAGVWSLRLKHTHTHTHTHTSPSQTSRCQLFALCVIHLIGFSILQGVRFVITLFLLPGVLSLDVAIHRVSFLLRTIS